MFKTAKYMFAAALLLGALGGCALPNPFSSEPTPTAVALQPTQPAATPKPEPIVQAVNQTVAANGRVRARQDVELSFAVSGTVDEIFAREGEMVTEGEVLAMLDPRRLEQAVRNAEAQVARAQAQLTALTEDPVPAQARSAAAQVEAARANLQQVRGSVTSSDIEAARENLNQARAALADLRDGASEEDIRAARAQRDAAAAALETQRSQLSHNKTQAEIQIGQASDNLAAAQSNFSSTYWNWRESQNIDIDIPIDTGIDIPENIRQLFSDQLVQAEAQLRQAEQNLELAQLRYDQAREAEVSGLQQAQAQLDQAQARLDQILQPPSAVNLAQAQAQVERAEAELARLTGSQRAGQIEAAAAQLDQAQASRDQLYADPTESQLQQAQANLVQAEAQLAQALLNREDANLAAPFSGEIVAINIDMGDTVQAGRAVIRLVDTSQLYVEVEVNDNDIVLVEEGQPVDIVVDARPDRSYRGEVAFVAPASTNDQGVTTYDVRIDLREAAEEALRIGMSVTANIQVEQER